MLIILLPAVLAFMYYVGFITMTKLKINQADGELKTHFLRILFGFLAISVLTLFILSVKWLLLPDPPQGFK
nr:hypothetical protein [uncultured Chryseobacterium sp.]